MQVEQLLSLAGIVLVMVGTPGPNNLMLLASGVNFGVRRSLPHVAGIVVGCEALLLSVAFGLGQLLLVWPNALVVLQVLGALFLIYMAGLLIGSKSRMEGSGQAIHPMSFAQAFLFQWVNPKAWMICVALIASYTRPDVLPESIGIVALVLLVVGTPLILLWNIGGYALQYWLKKGNRLRWFNWLMALLLIASIYPMVT